MTSNSKKRHCVSYEKMSPEVAEAFVEKYPKGFNDYLPDLVKYPKPDGSFFYAVTLETADSIYLVKIKIETDNLVDVENWLEDEESNDSSVAAAGADEVAGELPEDDYSKYSDDGIEND